MKIELLSDNKLKLFLSATDLSSYGLTYASLNYDEPVTKRAFQEMLKKVKELTGVSLNSSRLLVEARPTASQGCILQITRQERGRPVKRNYPLQKQFFSFALPDDFLDFQNLAHPFSHAYEVYHIEDAFYISCLVREENNALLRLASEFGDKCSFYIEQLLEERGERLGMNQGVC